MKRNMKIFSAALALVLVFGAVVGGTLAWLMDKTESITNTFTAGKVDISMKEVYGTGDNDYLDAGENAEKDFKMIPGDQLTKDPIITVDADSEACYLYVEVNASENLAAYIDYDMVDGWIQLNDAEDNPVENVFYREVNDADADQSFHVIGWDSADENAIVDESEIGKVYVLNTITNMDTLTEETYPTLTFTAYAVQQKNLTDAYTAWTSANFEG